MRCSRCDGEMEDRIVRFCVCDASPVVLVENVPAKVCRRCEEKYFSGAVIDIFESIRDGQTVPGRNGRVLVFDYNELTQADQTNGHRQAQTNDPGTTALIGFGSPQQMEQGQLVAASERTEPAYE